MPAIRVLVIDDSVVIRKVLCEALATDPAIEVVGSASDGTIGLTKIAILKPDLVTLDVEMPGMSGLETLVEIRKRHPKLPVIMFSTLTERGASITLDALALGASDYVAKPSNTGSLEETRARIERELIPKVKGLCPGKRERNTIPSVRRIISIQTRIDVVAIGTSTGGPNALAEVLPKMPRDFPVPIVVVQHMPPLFTRLLAERLDKQSAVSIREGIPGAVLNPGEVWIAPGDLHMTVTREGKLVNLSMNRDSPENSCRPAVDPLFRSVAKAYGQHTLAVVLTGMGSDGVRGAQQVKEVGGRVIVQDEATSVVWGMPGQVAAAGLATGVFPLDGIAEAIERDAKFGRFTPEHRNAQQGDRKKETAGKVHG